MRAFEAAFSVTDRTRIVDIGGTCANWLLTERRPRLVMVNICPRPTRCRSMLFRFLPKAAKRALARNFTVWGLLTRPSRQQAVAFVDELRLLSRRQFSALFPGAALKLERWCGWTKSFSALKTH